MILGIGDTEYPPGANWAGCRCIPYTLYSTHTILRFKSLGLHSKVPGLLIKPPYPPINFSINCTM